ncbi:MAG: hypothetical protein H7X92_09855 [Chitinophagales bacterium]|nr:hypothetical protein [Hyphomicrobiales bacterium]
MEESVWAFGWSHLLTIVQIIATIAIALVGFKTFKQWKLQQIEDKRINTALEALSLAYESKFVFAYIRSPLSFSGEWEDMPSVEGESEQTRRNKGAYFVPLSRIMNQKDFFHKSYSLMPRFMALFGSEKEAIFDKLHSARKDVQIAGELLIEESITRFQPNSLDPEFIKQLKADLWLPLSKSKKDDQVGRKVLEFITEIEEICLPVINRTTKKIATPV